MPHDMRNPPSRQLGIGIITRQDWGQPCQDENTASLYRIFNS